MRSARLSLALETGALTLPPGGRIAVYGPRAGDDLSMLPRDRVVALTGFKPDHDHFAASVSVVPDPPYAAAIVCLPRSREAARALIARAAAEVEPGGWIAVDGQKFDGVDTALKDLRSRVDLSDSLSKAHGKLASFQAGPDLSDWRAKPHQVDRFQTLPGIFSADGPDPGAVLLAAHLPDKLGGKVADLGAGWGYLAAEILKRPRSAPAGRRVAQPLHHVWIAMVKEGAASTSCSDIQTHFSLERAITSCSGLPFCIFTSCLCEALLRQHFIDAADGIQGSWIADIRQQLGDNT